MKLEKKQQLAQKRRYRIRKKVKGTADRPRLTVKFTDKHIYAQCICDVEGKTIVSLSTLCKEKRDDSLKANIDGATALGKAIGEKALAANIKQVVFDRAGKKYHGVVKAFADSAREAGLEF